MRGPAAQAASHPGTRPLKASAEVAFSTVARSNAAVQIPLHHFAGDISFRLDRAAIRSPQGAQFRPTCVVASAPIVSSRSQPCTKAERQAMPVPARRRKQGAATRSGAASPGSITGRRRSLGQVAARPMSSACEMVAAGSAFHARTFAPCWGIFEDPAAAAFAGVLLRFAPSPDGDHALNPRAGV